MQALLPQSAILFARAEVAALGRLANLSSSWPQQATLSTSSGSTPVTEPLEQGGDQHQQPQASSSGSGNEDGSSSAGCSRERMMKQITRQALAAEVGAAAFYRAQSRCALSGPRPDLEYFRDQERQLMQEAKEQLHQHRARPSALQGVLGAAGLALGAVASVVPRRVNMAIAGALQDALTEHFTEQMRRMHESGRLGPEDRGVRDLVRGLRDADRAPDGAPPAPDLLAYSRMKSVSDLGLEGAVGAVVKAGTLAALSLTAEV